MNGFLLAAIFGAATHLYFGSKEIFGWKRKFVEKAAKAWPG